MYKQLRAYMSLLNFIILKGVMFLFLCSKHGFGKESGRTMTSMEDSQVAQPPQGLPPATIRAPTSVALDGVNEELQHTVHILLHLATRCWERHSWQL